MNDQELARVFLPLEDGDIDENRVSGSIVSDQLNLWLENAPTFSSNSMEEAHVRYSNMINDLSSFEVPSSLPPEQMNPAEISRSEEIILTALAKGQSSGTKASDSPKLQTKEKDLQEDGPNEDPETSDRCRSQKRTRSAEVHNMNERLRRQKLKEKMKALRELIPNCNKRDKASTLDDAMNYIKALQYQIQQMMSAGEGHSTWHSPLTVMQGMQIPTSSTALPSFRQTGPPRGRNTGGMEYEIETGVPSGMFSSFNFPTRQLGLLPSPATSGLPGIIAAPHSVRYPGNYLCTTSFPSSGSQSTTRGRTSSSQGDK